MWYEQNPRWPPSILPIFIFRQNCGYIWHKNMFLVSIYRFLGSRNLIRCLKIPYNVISTKSKMAVPHFADFHISSDFGYIWHKIMFLVSIYRLFGQKSQWHTLKCHKMWLELNPRWLSSTQIPILCFLFDVDHLILWLLIGTSHSTS